MTHASTSSISNPVVLAVDAASSVPGVSIVRGNQLLASLHLRGPLAHAESLVGEIASILKRCSLSFSEVDALAITLGPGSFTGVRIGLATVKGLAFAHPIPTYGVPSLRALAMLHPHCERPIVPLVDLRRGRVYSAVYDSRGRWPESVVEGKLRSVEEALELAPSDAVFVGDGARALASEGRLDRSAVMEGAHSVGVASVVATYIASAIVAGQAEADLDLTPQYLQASAAEAKAQPPI